MEEAVRLNEMLFFMLTILAVILGICGGSVVILIALAGKVWKMDRQEEAKRANQDDPRY